MASSTPHSPSIIWGTLIISGTIIGAGMFSLPVVMSGAWFGWSLLAMLLTWGSMLLSGLHFLEANLHYPSGASFATVTRDLLGRGWSRINGLSILFVLGILTYAYISASGAIWQHTLNQLGLPVSARTAGAGFTLLVALFIWLGTGAASRMTLIFLGAKLIAFLMIFGGLLWHAQPAALLGSWPEQRAWFPYVWMVLPFCLASFGYHGNISGLMVYYRKNVRKVVQCLVAGTVLALSIYLIWMTGTMGNLPRGEFVTLAQRGGNIDVLVEALSGLLNSPWLSLLLTLFSTFAVASSFLGVTLGLFDYLADLTGARGDRWGRAKTTLLTFALPLGASLIWPQGFLVAIGYAGLAATLWAVITPALLARQARRRFTDGWQAPGGQTAVLFVLAFGALSIITALLSLVGWLPVYAR
ncbi:tryptophan permease [Pantoea sp. 1.19]|uniref:tryptophan permease n=1 Tax=Pantoea sp. 1.19 TaxID=1925589 RepID=UPI000948E21B|nr:tryptophan permease [Pantoea sp. 1.19]